MNKKSTTLELENKANEILFNLPDGIKTKYANIERQSMKIFLTIATIVFLFMCIMFFSIDNHTLKVILFIVILSFEMVFMIFVVNDGKKADDKLAFRYIKKKLLTGQKFNIEELKEQNERNSEFSIKKEISIMSNGWSSTKLLIDNENKKFIYQSGKSVSKTYSFSDIINYEVYENGKSKVQGRAGSALIGGAFFGLGGAIVGASRSKNIDEKCTQLKLFIRLNDLDCPQIVITYVDNVNWNKSGWTYRNMKENLQSVCSVLEFMLNNKTLEQSETKQSENNVEPTKKEQLQELKEMLDDGLITQDDFDLKKKQILGL